MTLPYPPQCQRYSNWCWCAVTSSLTQLYAGQSTQPALDQFDVFQQCAPGVPRNLYALPGPCAQPGNPTAFDVPADFGSVLQDSFDMLRSLAATAPFGELADSIRRGEAPVLQLAGSGSFRHVIGITGFSANNGRQTLIVEDPLHGHGVVTVDDLMDYFGLHWTDTYFTRPRP